MNINVIKDATMPTDLTGGEYATSEITIYVDPKLPERTQRINVIHSVIENYFRPLDHKYVDEVCQYIEDALDYLV